MTAWLGRMYDVVEGPLAPTRTNIEAQMEGLIDVVEPDEQVLVYYAGHGKQALPDPALHDRPVAALLPIDACEPTPSSTRLIPGNELVGWLGRLADACGVPLSEPLQRSRRRDRIEPSVTMIFECCHSAGLMDQWPESIVDCEAIVQTMERRLKEHIVRGPSDPLSRVVRVMASGRDEWAQGPTTNDVGLMTEALVDLLERYPDEPWWAVMDRLQTQWNEPTQHPQIAGPDALVPLIGRRIEPPEELWPCGRMDADRWSCTLARGAGCRPGQRVVLTSSLATPPHAGGCVELDEGDVVIRLTRGAEAAIAGHDFAWATRPSLRRRAIVEVRGGDEETRGALVERLRPCTTLVYDRGAEPSQPDGGSTTATAAFEISFDGVTIHDRWGDAVVRTGSDDQPLWEAWLDRLVVLQDWLDMAGTLGDWPPDSFALRWGTWHEEQRQEWDDTPRVLSTQTPLWVELEASITCVPAFVSLFRVRADRAVEALTPHVPGGLPVTGWYPLAGLDDEAEPLRFEWPRGLRGEQPRWEQLVVMISDRPIPLARLQRGAVTRRVSRGQQRQGGARLGMLVRRYRLALA